MGDVDVLALRYGQKLRLRTASAYVKSAASSSSTSTDVGIGYYEKNGRHGILSCVPPLGAPLDYLFNEDEYLVLDPSNRRAPGDIVEYGHTVVLVNQHGMVWNNKTGGITGYIGPRPRSTPGEMFVTFRRGGANKEKARDKERAATLTGETSASSLMGSSSSSSNLGEQAAAAVEGPVHFGDANVSIGVAESNRHSQMFNKRLSNFKKPTSKIQGGYICCDGKGTELRFTICPAKPKVEQISMLNKLITAYNYGQKIALPVGVLEKQVLDGTNATLQQADIQFKLSNQTSTTLTGAVLHEKILEHAAKGNNDGDHETEFTLQLINNPGELVVKLTGIVPKRALQKLTTIAHKARKSNPAMPPLPAIATVTPLQQVGGVVRKVPVPAFALVYALLTHFLWNGIAEADGGARRQLTVAVLLLVPAFYISFKVHHPLSSNFHASTPREAEVDEDAAAAASLKLIITEYRFGVERSLESSGSSSSLSNGQALVVPGSTGIVPLRYINAEKGDEAKARERYITTLAWRKENELDTILERPWPHFRLIKQNYPHFYHKRGKNHEPVYYEKPGKINLKALKAANVKLSDLMYNYLMVTEFLWQVLEPDDNGKCISVLDVEGIRLSDFAGEAVEYVRNAASVSGGHYPERCAYIFVINVPSWFSIVWNTVKTMVDEVTRQKVFIISGSKKKIFEALAEKIPVENIPEEYGGESVGMSKEETLLFNLMAYLNPDEKVAPKTNPIHDYRREQAAVNGTKSVDAATSVATASASIAPLKKV